MTQTGLADYYMGVPSEWATGKTRKEARENLTALLANKATS